MNLDFIAADLVFVAPGLDFVAAALVFVVTDLAFVARSKAYCFRYNPAAVASARATNPATSTSSARIVGSIPAAARSA